jgi:hypothetical protein
MRCEFLESKNKKAAILWGIAAFGSSNLVSLAGRYPLLSEIIRTITMGRLSKSRRREGEIVRGDENRDRRGARERNRLWAEAFISASMNNTLAGSGQIDTADMSHQNSVWRELR